MLNAEPTGFSQLTGMDRRLRAGLVSSLARLRHGALLLRDAEGDCLLGEPGGQALLMQVNDPAFYRLMATKGSVGAGEAWMEGYWHTPDLTALVRLLLRNRDLLDNMEGGLARLSQFLLARYYSLQRNSKAGSRRNIAAHYDLGNELFEQFLDRRMMYSSAWYREPDWTLEQAQEAKLRRIGESLQLTADDHLLEIGSGWGGLAVYMAEQYGCRVTTTTISRRQYEAAQQRVNQAGLAERVTLLRRDYRELTGQYSKLVSVEMVEAVGHQYLDRFFQVCHDRLAPGGAMLLQAITIEDHRYLQARDSVDFIKRYIFPGSFIPSASVLTASAAASRLRLTELFDMGPSYAQTLQEWRRRFLAEPERILALGYDRRFMRLWEFYLCYCEGGFREQAISDVQMRFHKPGAAL